jgi:DNA-cytosine methyltransferase
VNFTVLDLFSGIGGFSLGLERAGMETVAFCENDKFCQKVLAKHWPGVPIHDNIEELDGRQYRGTVELVCGGAPCQPFSVAGQQRGTEDDRALWPEMLRVIREVEPLWVIGENVAGIINMELDNVLSDLEDSGYSCQTFVIPACAVDAQHRRDRVWVIAQKNDFDSNRQRPHRKDKYEQRKDEPADRQISLIGSVCEVLAGQGNTEERNAEELDVANTDREYRGASGSGEMEKGATTTPRATSKQSETVAHTRSQGVHKRRGSSSSSEESGDKGRVRQDGLSSREGEEEQTVAHPVSESGRGGGLPTDTSDQGRGASRAGATRLQPEDGETQPDHVESGSEAVADTAESGGEAWRANRVGAIDGSCGDEGLSAGGCSQRNVADTESQGLEGWDNRGDSGALQPGFRESGGTVESRWLPESNIRRVSHGVPRRVDRLRSLGNAVVPQVVEVLGKAIIEIENLR